jgi:ankyrin repeat protein
MGLLGASGDAVVVQTLIDAGANPNCTTKLGLTPWDIAVFHSNADFATFLGKKPGTPSAYGTGECHSEKCDSCNVVSTSLHVVHVPEDSGSIGANRNTRRLTLDNLRREMAVHHLQKLQLVLQVRGNVEEAAR